MMPLRRRFSKAGYRLGIAAALEPFVGIANVNITADGFAEKGGEGRAHGALQG